MVPVTGYLCWSSGSVRDLHPTTRSFTRPPCPSLVVPADSNSSQRRERRNAPDPDPNPNPEHERDPAKLEERPRPNSVVGGFGEGGRALLRRQYMVYMEFLGTWAVLFRCWTLGEYKVGGLVANTCLWF